MSERACKRLFLALDRPFKGNGVVRRLLLGQLQKEIHADAAAQRQAVSDEFVIFAGCE